MKNTISQFIPIIWSHSVNQTKKLTQWDSIKIDEPVGTPIADCLWPILQMTLVSAWRLLTYVQCCGVKIWQNMDRGPWFGRQKLRGGGLFERCSLWRGRYIGTFLAALAAADTRGRKHVVEKLTMDYHISLALNFSKIPGTKNIFRAFEYTT